MNYILYYVPTDTIIVKGVEYDIANIRTHLDISEQLTEFKLHGQLNSLIRFL